jgi:hypothetical protein
MDDGELIYVHIYSPDDNYQIEHIPPPLAIIGMSPGNYVQFGHLYHVRLHVRENYTYIGESADNPKKIMKVPGFPVNPQNVKDKLKIYLTFS